MVTDSGLQQEVLNELKWEPSVDAAHIGVAAKDGVVTLSGHVPTFAEKHAAENAAKRVYGVRAVADELEVRLPGSLRRSDDEIAAACVTVLRNDSTVPDEKIKTIVAEGRVRLEGEVEWNFQKTAAERAVRLITGVRAVANFIQVKSKVSTGDVKQKIREAFERSAEIDSKRVGVDAHDGKVVLHGHVRSWLERNEAQRAAWSAPGVTSVVNELVVMP